MERIPFLYQCKRLGMEVEEELKEAQEERRKMIKEKGKGIVFQEKVQTMEEDEKIFLFFFKKAFSPNKVMKAMMDWQEEVKGKRMRDVTL